MNFIGILLNSISQKALKLAGHRRENKKQRDKRRVALVKKCKLTKEQIKQVNSFYKENYGKKISLKWHKLYTAISGKFDYRYFPELLYTSDYQRLANSPKYWKAIGDKNILPLIIKGSALNIKTPKTIASSSNGVILDENNNVISRNQLIEKLSQYDSFFIKLSIDSNQGLGVTLVNERKKGDELTNILDKCGKDFVVQMPIVNHEDLRLLNPHSLNTFRVITYIINGKIKVSPVILRIGMGDTYLDNAHAGGIFVGVSDDGTIISNGKSEFGLNLEEHPYSKIKFIGYKIKNVDKVINAAKRAATLVPHVGVIDWDIALDKDGEPLIIEANTYYGSSWFVQMSHGCSVFRDDTKDVLRLIRDGKILY